MSFEKDRDGPRKRKPVDGVSPISSETKRSKKQPASGEVGSALRSVYDRALAEDIPPEMLDLLGKLG